MPYIGRDLNRGNYLKLDDISSSFNGSTQTFNLTVGGSAFTPGSAFSILVSLGGVIQEPESAYQVNNSEITFANAPTAQDSFFCIALGVALGIGVPGNGTVNGTQIAKPFNYDGFFYLNDGTNRVGINSSIPSETLDIIGNTKISGILTASTYSGPIVNASGISTFYDLRVSNNLTVEGTTTTLDTNLIGVDRIEVGANSNTVVGVAITQSGTADILNLYDGSTEIFSVEDGGDIISKGQYFKIENAGSPEIQLTDTSSSNSLCFIRNSSGNLRLAADNNNVYNNTSLMFLVDGSEAMRINGSNVGIGTIAPLQKLHVTDDTSANIYIETKNGTTGSTAGIYYKTSNSTASGFFKTGIVLEDDGTSYARGKLHILQNNVADGSNATLSNSVVTFAQDGKVGIGITNPGSPLQIVDSSDASLRIFDNSGVSGDLSSSGWKFRALAGNAATNANGLEISHGTTERIHITTAGNIGIGTDNPKISGLHVDGVILAGTPYIQSGLQYGGIRLQSNHSGSQSGGVIYGGQHADNNHAIFFRRGYDGTLDTLDINEYGMFRIFTGGSLGSQAEKLRISGDKMRITSGISSISIGFGADAQRRVDIVTGSDNGVLIRPTTTSEGSQGSSNSIQDLIQLRNPWGSSAHNTGNAGARFGIQMRAYNGAGDFNIKDPAKSAAIYAVSEDEHSGYWKNVGLAFYTSAYNQNQAEKLRIDTNGNVGIGTNDPVSLLTLGKSANPTLEFKDYTNNARAIITGSAGGQLVFQTDVDSINANSDFIFRADSITNEIVRFKDTGEVGIGTDAPSEKLHLYGSVSTLIRVQNSDDGIAGITFANTGSSNWAIINEDAHLRFKLAGNEKVRINSSGQVGIGTDNPTQKVQINNGTDDPNIVLLYGADTSTEYAGIGVFQGNATFTGGGIGGTNAGISLRTAESGTEKERVHITSAGNVGIGTDNPRNSSKLDVHNPTSNGVFINYDGQSNAEYGLRIQSNGSGGNFESDFVNGTTALLDLFANSSSTTGGDLLVARTQSSTPVFLVKGNGDVGIGSESTGGARLKVYDNGTNQLLQQWRGNLGSTAGERPLNLYSPATDSNSDYFRFQTGNAIKFQIDTIDALCIEDGGNIGIGTDNPTQLIDVYKASNDAVIKTRTTGAGAYFEADSAATSAGYHGLSLSVSGTEKWFVGSYNSHNFHIKDGTRNAGAERFTIVDGTGKVGINSTAPTGALDMRTGTHAFDGFIKLTKDDNFNPSIEYYRTTGSGPTWYGAQLRLMTGDFTYSNSGSANLGSESYVERLRITNDGKVGIATASPTAKLTIGRVTGGYMNMVGIQVNRPHSLGLQNGIHVYTDAGYNNTASYQNAAFKATGTSGHAFACSTDAGSNGQGGTLNAKIDFDGDAHFLDGLGVGTASRSDGAKMEVFARGDTERGIYITDSDNVHNSPYLRVLGKRDDGNTHQSFSGRILLASLRTDAKVNSGRKVGVIMFGGNHTNTNESNILYPASIAAMAGDSYDSATDMPTDLVFYTGSTGRAPNDNNVSSGEERLRIQSGGNLHMAQDVRLVSKPNSTWGAGLNIGGNGQATSSTHGSMVVTNGNLHLDARDGSYGVYLNWYGGANGTYFGNGGGGQRGRIDGAGNLTLSGSYPGSDLRLKENIQNISGATDTIKSLVGKTFTWKAEAGLDDWKHYGFIAQEVQKVTPDLVKDIGCHYFDKDDKLVTDIDPTESDEDRKNKGITQSLTVNNEGVTPILVEAMKELIAKVEILEAKVAALEGS